MDIKIVLRKAFAIFIFGLPGDFVEGKNVQKEYKIVKLLGHGKGGCSYLIEREGKF